MSQGDEHGGPADEAAAVCYRLTDGAVQFLLIRTKGGAHWTFPKGHVESGETPWRAAQREAREEAGVGGPIESELLALYPHEKKMRDGRKVELTVAAYLLRVESESGRGEPGRDPTWFAPEEAKQKLTEGRAPRYQQAFGQVVDAACKRLERKETGRSAPHL